MTRLAGWYGHTAAFQATSLGCRQPADGRVDRLERGAPSPRRIAMRTPTMPFV